MWWANRPFIVQKRRFGVYLAVDAAGRMPAYEDLKVLVPNLDTTTDKELLGIQAAIEHYAENGLERRNDKQVQRLREDLWEFKGKAADFGLRLPFFCDACQRFVLLTAFRKNTPETPDCEIHRACALRAEHLAREMRRLSRAVARRN